MNNLLKNEEIFYNYSVNRYLLTNDEIEFFEIRNKIFLFYMNTKKIIYNQIKRFNFNIISLGYNCFPKTFLTKFLFMPPHDEKLPFDLQVTPLPALIKIFNLNFCNLVADGVSINPNGNKCFCNNGLKILFNHDIIINNKDIIDQISNFNKKIQDKIYYFINILDLQKTIFFLNIRIYNEYDLNNIYILKDILSKKYAFDRLFVTNRLHKGCMDINNNFIFSYDCVDSKDNEYVWYDFNNYFSYQGIAHEYLIAQSLKDYLKNYFPKKNITKSIRFQRSLDFYQYSLNYLIEKKVSLYKITKVKNHINLMKSLNRECMYVDEF